MKRYELSARDGNSDFVSFPISSDPNSPGLHATPFVAPAPPVLGGQGRELSIEHGFGMGWAAVVTVIIGGIIIGLAGVGAYALLEGWR